MSIWDDPELAVGGNYVTLEDVGDEVSGMIKVVRSHRFDDGKVAPQILLECDDGEERTLTAGQIKLKLRLLELRPEPGDHLMVRLIRLEKRDKKTLKHFDVVVTPGGKKPSASAAQSAKPPF